MAEPSLTPMRRGRLSVDSDDSHLLPCDSSDSSFDLSFDYRGQNFERQPHRRKKIINFDSESDDSPGKLHSSVASALKPAKSPKDDVVDDLNDLLALTKLDAPPTDPNWSLQTSSSSSSPAYYALHVSLETSPFLPPPLYTKLFSHQRCGIAWIHDVHNIELDKGYQGGILGDDMGLGKTYQSASYVLGMFYRHFVEAQAGLDWCAAQDDRAHNALIVGPTTLLPIWRKEFDNILAFFPSEFVSKVLCQVLSSTTRRRMDVITTHQSCSSSYNILITTYGLLTSTPLLQPSVECGWEHVFLDEGHKIKSSNTQVHKSCHAVCSATTRRLLITGTPVQNNLVELHALVTWVKGESLLGDKKKFKKEYSDVIDKSRSSKASEREKELGRIKSAQLREAIQPYIIARDKEHIFKDVLPKKSELVIWCEISTEQRALYTEYIRSKDVVDLTSGNVKKSPLVQVTYLKSLSSHPLLLTKEEFEADLSTATTADLLQASNKLAVLKDVIGRLRKKKFRTVIFSTSVKMISIMLKIFPDAMSITGSVVAKKRQETIDSFNDGEGDILILSTKVGGVGITLTSATRAVIYEPSWNPADDRQAVDRIYRIGQEKPCTIYRLLSSGTVEERMYEKQVFKDGVRRSVMEGGEEDTRYFDQDELKNLFELGEPGRCRVLEQHIPGKCIIHMKGKENSKTATASVSTPPRPTTPKYSSAGFSAGFGTPKLKGRANVDSIKTPIGASNRVLSPMVGATGRATFLEEHKFVVGVSKHDDLYMNGKEKDGGKKKEGGGTPFAKNNAKSRRKSLAYGADAGRSLFIDLSAKKDDEERANVDLEEHGLTVLGRGRGKVRGSKSRDKRVTARTGLTEVQEITELSSDDDTEGEMEDNSVEARDTALIGFEDDVEDEGEGGMDEEEEEEEDEEETEYDDDWGMGRGGNGGGSQDDAIELDILTDTLPPPRRLPSRRAAKSTDYHEDNSTIVLDMSPDEDKDEGLTEDDLVVSPPIPPPSTSKMRALNREKILDRLLSKGMMLEQENKTREALEIYLGAIEIDGDKIQKLKVHRRIAFISKGNGWLDEVLKNKGEKNES